MDKYSDGAKVRVKAGGRIRDPYSDIWQYENLTGEIVSSTTVIWQHTRSWERESDSPPELVRVYKIHLDIGIVADNVVEDRLEAWNARASPVGLRQPGAQETPCTHNKVDAVVRGN